MIVGSICYDVDSGLGHLARDFHRNGVIQKVLVIRHPRYQRHPEWYAGDRTEWSSARNNAQTTKMFLDQGVTHLLVFENAWCCWPVVAEAKRRGIKFALVPMYEWTPRPLPVKPDLVICPSLLDLEYFPCTKCGGRGSVETTPPEEKEWRTHAPCRCDSVHMTVPVDVPWRKRERALTFVHNAGHGQVGFAKGTPEVIEAMRHVRSGARLKVTGQPDEPRLKALLDGVAKLGRDNVEIVCAQLGEEERYAADVMVNAERYNGLSLPLQEAHASGMLVVTTDRFPANAWLPREPLIPFARSERYSVNQTSFDRVTVDPREIARVIDAWHGREIGSFSEQGRMWGEANSWRALGPQWKKLLEDL